MASIDPFFRIIMLPDRQIVMAARPITLSQEGGDAAGLVTIVSDRGVIVLADDVTIKGKLSIRLPAKADGTGGDGAAITILARTLGSLPGAGGDAAIDVSGGAGRTSAKIWTAPAATGPVGTPGHSIWHPITDDTLDGGTGLHGIDGANGDDGMPGGHGGKIDIRLFAAAEAAAIALTAAGGAGGAGQAGQQGGQGGHGGDGARSEIWPVGTPSAATAGGNGGPGGKGADGGAPGAGGMPGPIMLRMVNLGAAAFTPALEAGEPGAPGQGGAGGAGGTGGIGGIPVVRQTITAGPGGGYTWIDGSPLPSGRTPAATSSGKTPNKGESGAGQARYPGTMWAREPSGWPAGSAARSCADAH